MNINSFALESTRLNLRHILDSLISQIPQNYEANAALLDSKGAPVDITGLNPLHFCSFESCLKSAKKYISIKPGEILITNDPYSGSPRLCDLMFLMGAFQDSELRYYVALQISLPVLLNKKWNQISLTVDDEGYRIPPTPLGQNGIVNPALIDHLVQSGISRQELEPLMNQTRGLLFDSAQEVVRFEQNQGRTQLNAQLEELNKYSETIMRGALREIPDGEYAATDYLDNDGVDTEPVRLQCRLMVQGENISLNFLGSARQTRGPYNCNYATTWAACFWVFRSFVKEEIPINSGSFKAFSLEAPVETLVNPSYPAPLLGGYYETSARVVDVLYMVLSKALPFEIPSQNGGSTNPFFMKFEKGLMVETLPSGTGADKKSSGQNCIHGSLVNSALQSIEETEKSWPIQITQAGIREGSGGHGKNNGGAGLTREYRILEPATLLLLGDRRKNKPHGFFGGTAGLPGENLIGKKDDRKKAHNEKRVVDLQAGDSLVINTPGGGGWGKLEVTPEP